jgi:hypothetical protein
VTISRWGGNAVTAYNPNGQFTNAGNDWYFENRGSDDAAEWLGWVQGAGSQTLLTVPACVLFSVPRALIRSSTDIISLFAVLTGSRRMRRRTRTPSPSIHASSLCCSDTVPR